MINHRDCFYRVSPIWFQLIKQCSRQATGRGRMRHSGHRKLCPRTSSPEELVSSAIDRNKRCNKQQPCSNCIRRGISHSRVWPVDFRRHCMSQ
ncbi:hypothetical protein M438DRAFT_38908 [Aureobasidium pullulans EXF-150]|uniref:Zn(2)-C6 fungal-type domain-containing protein n=1 Tax=Aureobasidium pullulans EXF-150 TaxID=1043002 RepID=A0A074Y7V1_AURPU|nr:uncharacterized protein M438DRAFT_38908 [Aureobasidium pullulans EXF-150]KEQ82951.1 hypothetical protein M438DRAFT_38908 [Aureobasidium pullulans EXF-150]